MLPAWFRHRRLLSSIHLHICAHCYTAAPTHCCTAMLLHSALLHCYTALSYCMLHVPNCILDFKTSRTCTFDGLNSCREQLSRLSVHVEIASKINRMIEAKDLTDVGKLEQDLVFGDATSKEIITYISANQKMSAEDKVCPVYETAKLQQTDLASVNHLGIKAKRRIFGADCICA